MTAALRHSLRLAVDRAARASIDWQADPRCVGCGVEQADPFTGLARYVAGCRTCTDRRYKRAFRPTASAPVQLVFEGIV